jgi:hypothetical protein
MKEANGAELENMLSGLTAAVSDARVFDKDELTKGVPITREGFSFSFPKIVQGDDSGTDHRRSNKFIEEDSNDFTDKYFNSKQCSIGSGIGGISMFGSNELLEGTTRNTVISGIYDFAGKYSSAIRSDTDRATYFKDCVYDPVYRSQNGAGDFRVIKKQMYDDINNQIINIKRCTARFNTEILFNTSSDITADISKPIYLSNMKSDMAEFTSNILYKSLIAGNTNSDKMKNIQPLNKGSKGDNASDQTYSNLLQSINSNGRYIYNDALKQKHLNIYSKVYGYRKRIDEILSMMRDQTKNDAAKLYTVRVDETIVQELRMILSYLMIIERTNDIIKFEMNYSNTNNGMDIYGKLGNPTLEEFADEDINNELVDKINGANSIFKIPLEDDTYNTNDEKRYLYGITYYFNSGP